MQIERERRFKIKCLPDLSKCEKKKIIQNYLYKDSFTSCRKRKIIYNNKTKYIYTCKCKATSEIGTTVEIETEISKEKYDSLGNGYGRQIVKDRYLYKLDGGIVAEIDIFKGEFYGIGLVEVEFKNKIQADNFVIPDWFGEEIKGKLNCNIIWSNSRLAKMTDWQIARVKEELKVK